MITDFNFRVEPNHPILTVEKVPNGSFFKKCCNGEYFLKTDQTIIRDGEVKYTCVSFPGRLVHYIMGSTKAHIVPKVEIKMGWD